MLIILCLYIVGLWVVFSKFKLVRWGWASGTVAVLVGVFILAISLALFNYLTPSGRVTVGGRVVEVPISFVDRVRGTSKMSSRIVIEALGLVTWWALRDRLFGRRRA